MRRIVILLALVMAAVVVLSAPAATAKKKHHNKKHHNSPPSINVVQCPTASDGVSCVGTDSNDYLVGRDGSHDFIQGGEGNDVYDGKGGDDFGDVWLDRSHTSSDYYLVSVKDFGASGGLVITDFGGSLDTLDLSRFYKSSDFAYSRDSRFNDLVMDGPGLNDIYIGGFCTTDSVDLFKFSDKTLTTQQVKDMVP
jgi:hypothetical protein